MAIQKNKRLIKQLLLEVKDWIIKHPESYDQDHWCGTQCCIAGHLVLRAGIARQDDDGGFIYPGGKRCSDHEIVKEAASLLGGDYFLCDPLSNEIQVLFDASRGDEHRDDPQVGANRIDNFIAAVGL